MNILELLEKRMICADGGFGTALIKHGMGPGELSERWNIAHPDDVIEIHRSFLDAGADVILANTFGANVYHYDDEAEMEQVIRAGVANAKRAVELSGKEAFVALDIGSTGKLLPPMGMLPFDEAVESFAKMIRIGADAGADLIWVETMNDIYELKAAVVAARENCDLPIFATAVYDANARMMSGASPECVVAMLEGLGVSALGLNCGVGPEAAKKSVEVLSQYASVPLIVKPNAGLPHMVDGMTVYDVTPDDFAKEMEEILKIPGVGVIGGCCGTTPEHIRAAWDVAATQIEGAEQSADNAAEMKNITLVASSQMFLDISDGDFELGMSIDASQDEDLLADLQDGFVDSVMDLADEDADDGAEILNIKLSGEDVDEPQMMKQAIIELQNLNMLPLSIQSTDPEAVREALRIVNGKAMVNLTDADAVQIESVLPVVKKYGAVVFAQEAQKEDVTALAKEAGIACRELIF